MGDTEISWTDKTWNPVRGCSRVSAGCERCYAERTAGRFGGSRWTGKVRLVTEHLADPLRWRDPKRIFVNSMSDLFHETLTNEEIAAVFGVMAAAPQHTFQVLTKRAKRMREWFDWIAAEAERCNAGVGMTPAARCFVSAQRTIVPFDLAGRPTIITRGPVVEAGTTAHWPLANVWLGVSVENQAAADERIPELLRTPAAVRFLSCEPLLGPVDLRGVERGDTWSGGDWLRTWRFQREHDDGRNDVLEERASRIDWVIAGCESGPGARGCDVAWLRSLRDQCAAADVAYFLKQAVGTPGQLAEGCVATWVIGADNGSKSKAAGVIELPYLDGVQWNQFPEVSR